MNALDILQAGLANVGVAHAIATAEHNKGFAYGTKAGTGRGVLMALDCAKKRFGSKLMGLLADEVERRHGEELMG